MLRADTVTDCETLFMTPALSKPRVVGCGLSLILATTAAHAQQEEALPCWRGGEVMPGYEAEVKVFTDNTADVTVEVDLTQHAQLGVHNVSYLSDAPVLVYRLKYGEDRSIAYADMLVRFSGARSNSTGETITSWVHEYRMAGEWRDYAPATPLFMYGMGAASPSEFVTAMFDADPVRSLAKNTDVETEVIVFEFTPSEMPKILTFGFNQLQGIYGLLDEGNCELVSRF